MSNLLTFLSSFFPSDSSEQVLSSKTGMRNANSNTEELTLLRESMIYREQERCIRNPGRAKDTEREVFLFGLLNRFCVSESWQVSWQSFTSLGYLQLYLCSLGFVLQVFVYFVALFLFSLPFYFIWCW